MKRACSQSSGATAANNMLKFNGIRTFCWILLIVRLDWANMEVPPVLTKGNVEERLKHSTVKPDEINNIHFTSRGRMAGASGMVHLSMHTNVSSFASETRRACSVPDKMLKKITAIMEYDKRGNVIHMNQSEKVAQAERYVQYERLHYTMKKR